MKILSRLVLAYRLLEVVSGFKWGRVGGVLGYAPVLDSLSSPCVGTRRGLCMVPLDFATVRSWRSSSSLLMCEPLKQVRGLEAVASCIRRIQHTDSEIRAFVDFQPDQAMAAVKARVGQAGALEGMPVAVKAIFDVEGMESDWGTPIHAGRIARSDAAVVKMLKQAGAIIIGTTVSTEYANVAAGPTRNPHNLAHTPGGSSSGSAAAVAAGMVPLAIGTQTVGSIIRPSTYCGVFGLKPTHGAISLEGAMPLAPPLDTAGLIAADLDTLYAGFRALVPEGAVKSTPLGPSPAPISEPRTVSAAQSAPPTPPESTAPGQRPPLSIVYLRGPFEHRVSEASAGAVQRALTAARKAGVEVREVRAPASLEGMEAEWTRVLLVGLGAHHGADRDHAGEQMSVRLKALIDEGRGLSEQDEAEAVSRLAEHRRVLTDIIAAPHTVFLTPATDGVAPLASEEGTGPSTLQGIWSSTGLPALALPCGFVDALPVGVQLSTHPGGEELLFAVARELCPFLPSSRRQNDAR